MSAVEPDVKDFLKRIVWSISATLLWFLVNMTIGIFAGWLFFEERPTTGNIVFYIWMIITLAGLFWFLLRTWKKKFPHG